MRTNILFGMTVGVAILVSAATAMATKRPEQDKLAADYAATIEENITTIKTK